jgi:CheY-like chemotaxis protein
MSEAPSNRSQPPIRTDTSSKLILCVDDNEGGLLIRKQMLELFGFQVHLATSGDKALELLDQYSFSLAIIDYRMPVMDGAELAKRIKHEHPGTHVIMLSGYPHEIPPQTLQLVDVLVVKGERPERLLETVLKITGMERRSRSVPHEELRRRNTDHIEAVRRYLKEGHQRGR